MRLCSQLLVILSTILVCYMVNFMLVVEIPPPKGTSSLGVVGVVVIGL